MNILFRKGLDNTLRPFGDEAAEWLQKLKPNECVEISPRRLRNPRQHRLWWALCRKVAENIPEGNPGHNDPEWVSNLLKLKSGWTELISLRHSGETYQVIKSMSFDTMGQDEFETVFARAQDVIVQEILPGVGRAELYEAVMQMLGRE